MLCTLGALWGEKCFSAALLPCARKELLVFSYIKVLVKFQELLFVSVNSILFLNTLRGSW